MKKALFSVKRVKFYIFTGQRRRTNDRMRFENRVQVQIKPMRREKCCK